MKKIIAALFFLAVSANAAPSFDTGYSTFTSVGVALNSAPQGATIINSRPHGFWVNVGMYRLTNTHPTWDMFVGDVDVSTDKFHAKLGHLLKANGGTIDWPVGKDYRRNSVLVPVYARPADSATVDPLPRISVTWFGF